MKNNEAIKFISCLALATLFNQQATADTLCTNKKTKAVVARAGNCKSGESATVSPKANTRSTSATAADTFGATISLSDTGAVSSGSDNSTGLDVTVNRTGATGGSINNTGVNISVVGDAGGDSTAVGLLVSVAGSDANYSGIFTGGNVGIGTANPDEMLQIEGRLHLAQTSAPSTTTNKLYNVGGTLYWGGQEIAVGDLGGSEITSIVAGSGLSGGGSSGVVTLSVDSGTSANQLVKLNSSAELPAVSGANLTALNATNIASGTISDTRLSSNVSLLGSSITLSSEVAGTLPVANGGTGQSSLSNLITLGNHTSGNYVASVATSGGLSGGASASEGAALSLSVDQSFSPTWSGSHSFQSSVNVGTTSASVEMLHLNGRLHMEQAAAPTVTTDKLYNVSGQLYFNGQNLSSTAAGGDITGVTAGTGLSGGGTSGTVTLTIDSGTTANKVVQLNSSAQIPAVSGALLTNLNASSLASGTVDDARLSASVSLLGSSIGLGSSEVSGTLGIANGGTGATSLSNLIALTTHTTGNYVASVAAGTGIGIVSSGAEGGTATVSLDTAVAPTWTAQHTYSGVAADITTATNENFCVMPNGTGLVGIGTTTPSAKLDTEMSTSLTTGAIQKAAEFTITDNGVVTTGVDNTYGADIQVNRSGASGGLIYSTGLNVLVSADTGGTSTATGLDVYVSGADVNYAAILRGGLVGIGTSAPTAMLDVDFSSGSVTAATERGTKINVADTGVVTTGTDTTYGLEIDLSRTGTTTGNADSVGLDIAVSGDAVGAGTTTTTGLAVTVSGADTNVAAKFVGGSVSLGGGTSVTNANVPSGSLVVDNGVICVDNSGNNCDDSTRTTGTIYAVTTTVSGVDLAEEFPIEAGDQVLAAEIVMINSKKVEVCEAVDCTKHKQSYVPFVTRATSDPKVAKRIIGVVSTLPGVRLGGYGQEDLVEYQKVPVALAGRVPVKVSKENGAIEIGDRITVSSVAGVAMKASAGAVELGIALEPLEKDEGIILVLVK